jgi:photosystem II stability/assembly factor-like uncharacterized protein
MRQVIILVLLVIPIFVAWQVLNYVINNTDPTVAGRPLSNPKTHLHQVALGGKPGIIYLGTHYGFFSSTDGGRSWPQQRGKLNTLMILNIVVSPANPQVLAVIGRPTSGLGNLAGIYFSSDGGENWHLGSSPAGLSPSAYLFTVQAGSGSAGHFYAFYEYAGWFETRDMGVHWYPITRGALSSMLTPSLLSDPSNPNHLLLGGDQGLYESRDDGDHWKQITGVSGNVLNLAASSATPRLVFCTTDQGLYRWHDGSTQITHIASLPMSTPPARLVSSADGHILYGLSGQDLWYSNDSGTTWKHRWQFDRGDLVSLLVDPQHPDLLYVGFFLPPKVIFSTDGGNSWQTLTD